MLHNRLLKCKRILAHTDMTRSIYLLYNIIIIIIQVCKIDMNYYCIVIVSLLRLSCLHIQRSLRDAQNIMSLLQYRAVSNTMQYRRRAGFILNNDRRYCKCKGATH
jgi:hypothetical protein